MTVRVKFREAVMDRDGYQCKMCGGAPPLDVFQITDRDEMPFGGFVKENGIVLCRTCFDKAAMAAPGYTSADLYAQIHSSREEAVATAMVMIVARG